MRRASSGQALVEFALVSVILITLILGVIDFSWLFTIRTQSHQATIAAARYAAVNPEAWSSSPTPPANTIEGRLVAGITTLVLPNDDSHISITYWVPDGSTGTQCGHYSASLGAFNSDHGYALTACLSPGNIVQIQATYTYRYITPFLAHAFTSTSITTTASVMEEVAGS